MPKARFHSRFFFIVFSSLLLSREAVAIVDSTWNVDANGNWGTAGNWTAGVPQTADDIARFLGKITAPRTISLDINAEIAELDFDNANAYTIADTGLTLNFSTSSPVGTTSINITNANGNGNHDLGTSTGYARDLTINHNSTGTFTVSGSLSGPSSVTLTKAGTGTTIFGTGVGSNGINGTTFVTGGVLKLNKAVFAIGSANISLGTTVQNLASGQILPGATFTVAGTYDLNSQTDTIGLLNGSGSVTLGSGTLTLGLNGLSGDFSGVISGATGKIAVDAGSVGVQTFSGTSANTYTGLTTVSAGTLQANKTAGVNAIGGALTIDTTGTFKLLASNQIPDTVTVTVSGGTATFDLNGQSETIGLLTGDGNVSLGAGALTMGTGANSTFSGVIGGSGTVTKQNGGTINFTGTSPNTYTGLTTITGGALNLAKTSGVTAIAGDITVNTGTNLTLGAAEQIADTSTVTVNGTGAFIFNNNSETIGLLSGDGNVVLGTNALLTLGTASSSTFSGFISGSGTSGITKQGSGTFTLSGTVSNTYTGTTTVNNGILALAKTGGVATAVPGNVFIDSTGTVRIDVAGNQISNGSTVTLNAAGATFNLNAISETIGTLVFNAGTLSQGGATLSLLNAAALTMQGGTTISGPIIFIGPAGTTFTFDATNNGTATISGTVGMNAGIRTFNVGDGTAAIDTSISGIMSNGGVTKTGPGLLQLSGANTYVQATTVSAGTLQAGAASTFPSGSSFTVTATLDLNTFSQTIANLSGAGGTGIVKLNGATLTTGSLLNTSYDGVIIDGTTAGGGLTKVGNGIFTISGANTYSGTTLVSAGTLTAGAANTFSPNSDHTVNSTLNLNTFPQTIGLLSGIGIVNLNAATGILTFGTGGSSTYSGTFQAGGAIIKQGAGTVTLAGAAANSQLGITTITAGTLALSKTVGVNAIPVAGATINGTGTLRLDASNQIANGAPITIDASGATFNTNGFTEVIGSLTFNAGTLSQGGATLSMANPVTALTMRNTTISGPIALLTTGAVVFDATNNGTATISGTIDLNAAAHTFTINNGTAAVDMSVSGVISNGSLTKQGAGLLQFSGANTYVGSTTVTTGTLQAGATNTFSSGSAHSIGSTLDLNTFSQTIDTISGSGSVTLNGGTLTTGAAVNTSFAGSISDGSTGGGGLTKQNAGIFTLSGTNTYTGPTSVSVGTLQGGATNAFSPNSDYTVTSILDLQTFNQTIGLLSGAGTVTSSAILTTGTSGNSTFSGTLTGGTLNKAGSGILFLTGGASSISAATVSAGRLAVNTGVGTPLVITGSLTVGSGASLGGTGAITCPNITIQSGGTLSPGNSIGTLHVTGAVTQAAGSTFDVELLPSGGTILHDELDITGSYTIQPGATLLIEPGPGIYPSTFMITIVDASPGMLSGQFSNIVITLPTFSATVEYLSGPGDVVLAAITTLPINVVVTGGNAGAVAACLDTLSPAPGSDMELVIAELRQIPTVEGLTAALDELQPSQYTALALAEESTTLNTNDTIFARLRQITQVCPYVCSSKPRNEKAVCPPKKSRAFWISPYAATSHQRDKNDQPGFKTWAGGATAGMDFSPSDLWTFGGALGYSHDHLNWHEGAGRANMQNGYGALYAGLTKGHGFLFGSVMGSYNHYDTRRHIDLGPGVLTTIDRTAKGSHNGGQGSGHLEGGFLFGKKVQFSPFLGADYIYVHEGSFNEHGADGLNLHVKKKNSDLLQGELGLEIARCFSMSRNHFSPYVAFSVIREWRFMGKHTKSSFKGSSCVMKTTGMNPDRTLFSPQAGLTFLIPNENCTLSVEYRGKFGEKFNDNRVLAQFLYKF